MIKSHIQKIVKAEEAQQARSRVACSKQRIFKYRKLSEQSSPKSAYNNSSTNYDINIKRQLNLNDAPTIRSDEFRNSYVSINAQTNTTFIDRLNDPSHFPHNAHRFSPNPNQSPHTSPPLLGLSPNQSGNTRQLHVTPVKFSYLNPSPSQNFPKTEYWTRNQKDNFLVSSTVQREGPILMQGRQFPTSLRKVSHNQLAGERSTVKPAQYLVGASPIMQNLQQREKQLAVWPDSRLTYEPVVYARPIHTPTLCGVGPIVYQQSQLTMQKDNSKNMKTLNNEVPDTQNNMLIRNTSKQCSSRYHDSASLQLSGKVVGKNQPSPQQLYETWDIKTQVKSKANANHGFLTFQQIDRSGHLQEQNQADRSITPPVLKSENSGDELSISSIRESKQMLNQSYSDLSLSKGPIPTVTSPPQLPPKITGTGPTGEDRRKVSSVGEMAAIWVLMMIGIMLILYQICR